MAGTGARRDGRRPWRAGDYFSVQRYFGGGPRHGRWYVNFERPYRRTRIGIDTFDLLLDLVVEPDLASYARKDEDEDAQGHRLGLIDDVLHAGSTRLVSRSWP